jgi:uncharacterized protein involved in exopolysaccharide biosynthesis
LRCAGRNPSFPDKTLSQLLGNIVGGAFGIGFDIGREFFAGY